MIAVPAWTMAVAFLAGVAVARRVFAARASTRGEARFSYRLALRGAKRLSETELDAIGVVARSPPHWPGLLDERAAALIDEAGA